MAFFESVDSIAAFEGLTTVAFAFGLRNNIATLYNDVKMLSIPFLDSQFLLKYICNSLLFSNFSA